MFQKTRRILQSWSGEDKYEAFAELEDAEDAIGAIEKEPGAEKIRGGAMDLVDIGTDLMLDEIEARMKDGTFGRDLVERWLDRACPEPPGDEELRYLPGDAT